MLEAICRSELRDPGQRRGGGNAQAQHRGRSSRRYRPRPEVTSAARHDGAARGQPGPFPGQAVINGVVIQTIVDTGASLIALSMEDAARVGIFPNAERLPGEPRPRRTARSSQPRFACARSGSANIRIHDVEAVVLPAGRLKGSLLGMSLPAPALQLPGDERRVAPPGIASRQRALGPFLQHPGYNHRETKSRRPRRAPDESRPSMFPKPVPSLAPNTLGYETLPMVKPTGFREYDARWLFEKEINLMGVQALGLGLGTLIRRMGVKPEIVTGHDFRSYSSAIKMALINGLMAVRLPRPRHRPVPLAHGLLRPVRARRALRGDGHGLAQRQWLDRREDGRAAPGDLRAGRDERAEGDRALRQLRTARGRLLRL